MRIAWIAGCLLVLSAPLFGRGEREGTGPQPAVTVNAETPADAREVELLSPAELARMIEEEADSFILIDVRTPQEYRSGAIPRAINIPYDQLGERPPAGDRSARIVVYCRSGNRSAAARMTLADMGYANVSDFGGIGRWQGELVYPD